MRKEERWGGLSSTQSYTFCRRGNTVIRNDYYCHSRHGKTLIFSIRLLKNASKYSDIELVLQQSSSPSKLSNRHAQPSEDDRAHVGWHSHFRMNASWSVVSLRTLLVRCNQLIGTLMKAVIGVMHFTVGDQCTSKVQLPSLQTRGMIL